MFCAAEIHAPETSTIFESVVTDGEMLPTLDCYVSSDPESWHMHNACNYRPAASRRQEPIDLISALIF